MRRIAEIPNLFGHREVTFLRARNKPVSLLSPKKLWIKLSTRLCLELPIAMAAFARLQNRDWKNSRLPQVHWHNWQHRDLMHKQSILSVLLAWQCLKNLLFRNVKYPFLICFTLYAYDDDLSLTNLWCFYLAALTLKTYVTTHWSAKNDDKFVGPEPPQEVRFLLFAPLSLLTMMYRARMLYVKLLWAAWPIENQRSASWAPMSFPKLPTMIFLKIGPTCLMFSWVTSSLTMRIACMVLCASYWKWSRKISVSNSYPKLDLSWFPNFLLFWLRKA